jgi:hypothetical protein
LALMGLAVAAARPPVAGAPPTTPTTSAPLTISWDVAADQPVTVVVSGPNFSSNWPTGSAEPVGPVAITGGLCGVDPGVYHYDLVVTDALGRNRSKVVQFTITARWQHKSENPVGAMAAGYRSSDGLS